jgi:hypothetical protein
MGTHTPNPEEKETQERAITKTGREKGDRRT